MNPYRTLWPRRPAGKCGLSTSVVHAEEITSRAARRTPQGPHSSGNGSRAHKGTAGAPPGWHSRLVSFLSMSRPCEGLLEHTVYFGRSEGSETMFSGLYLLSFFIIVLGLILYYSSSTYVAQDPRVYKQFRNTGGPVTEAPPLGPMEPSVTYTSLGQEVEEEPRIRVA